MKIFFQERADEFSSPQASVNAIMKLNNCASHPAINDIVEYVVKGDAKYGLGAKFGGLKKLFKAAAKDAAEDNKQLSQVLDLS